MYHSPYPHYFGGQLNFGNLSVRAEQADGKLVAVSNYEPGGVRIFDAASLTLVADIPAVAANGAKSKTVGLVDIPGRSFVYALYDPGEIWRVHMPETGAPVVTKLPGVGKLPYDGNVTADGRFYLAGLFGEDGVALLDLWAPEAGVRRILDGYGHGEEPLPVYKMPHYEGWASVGDLLFLPAVGRHELLAVDSRSWTERARIPVHGQPVFAVARPDGREIWVNFAHPDNDVVQIVDVPSLRVVDELRPGRAVLHIEFTPRGEQAWVSARDDDKVVVLDTATRRLRLTLELTTP